MRSLPVVSLLILWATALHGLYQLDFTSYDRMFKRVAETDRSHIQEKNRDYTEESRVTPTPNQENKTETPRQPPSSGYEEYPSKNPNGNKNENQQQTSGQPTKMPTIGAVNERDEQNKEYGGSTTQPTYCPLPELYTADVTASKTIAKAYNLMEKYVAQCRNCNYWFVVQEILRAQIRVSRDDLILAMKAAETNCHIRTTNPDVWRGHCKVTGPTLYCYGYINIHDSNRYEVNCLPMDGLFIPIRKEQSKPNVTVIDEKANTVNNNGMKHVANAKENSAAVKSNEPKEKPDEILEYILKYHQLVTERVKVLLERYVTYCADCKYWMGVRDILKAEIHLPSYQLHLSMYAMESNCDVVSNLPELVHTGYCRPADPLLECSGYINLQDKEDYQVSCCVLSKVCCARESHCNEKHIRNLPICQQT
uniref:Saposin B-type domain-containing protein n=1 Tax=Trichuris muris TaxID=70415 RepID=A0A5S6QY08_TRIMR